MLDRRTCQEGALHGPSGEGMSALDQRFLKLAWQIDEPAFVGDIDTGAGGDGGNAYHFHLELLGLDERRPTVSPLKAFQRCLDPGQDGRVDWPRLSHPGCMGRRLK